MLAALAALALVAGAERSADPCRAAAAPLTRPADLPKDVARAVDAYRGTWRRACDSEDTLDVATLLGDAEVLAEDARTSRLVRAMAAAAEQRGQAWPFPAIRPVDGGLAVDWSAFASLGERGSVDDVRFWRGAVVAANGLGEPGWLREAPEAPGGVCARIGEISWVEVARAIEDMSAPGAAQYAGHARELRDRFVETLGAIAKGSEVCGCVPGDATLGLAALAATPLDGRRGTPAQRELVKAAGDALAAVRAGRARIRWLRQTPGGEPGGCRAP